MGRLDARHIWLGIALMAASGGTAAQRQLTTADYDRAARMLGEQTAPLVDGAVVAAWDGAWRVVWYQSDAKGGRVLAMPAGGGTPQLLFEGAALARAMGTPQAAPRLGALVRGLELDDGAVLLATTQGRFRCQAGTCAKQELPEVAAGDGPGHASPDGRREVFIRDWNLWMRELASGRETQLTTDGVTDYGYATDNAGWTHSDNAVVLWSPDSSKIATFRQDQRKLNTMTMVGTNVGAPRVEQWKYPFVGDEHVAMIERVIIDIGGATPKLVRLRMPPDFHRTTFSDDIKDGDVLGDAQWSADSRTLAFVSSDRGHRWAQLRVADAATGAVRDVYRETVATQYESGFNQPNWRYLPQSNEFLWYSQESGWGHLYLHDLASGQRKRQVTRGPWVVTQVTRVDPDSRTVWFRGVGREPGRDPYHVHYYKAGLDGGDVVLLTPEDANHVVVTGDDTASFVDTHSTIGSAPVTVLRDGDGKLLATLAKGDLSRLRAAGWVAPETFTVKARDGRTDLYGQMFKPSHFDAGNRYPLVVYIYPGPQIGSVRSRSFAAAHGDHQALAELGFIVVAIDGMGTPLRGKAFHDAYYGNMFDNTIPDQASAVQQLAARHPWIDGARVGIWGHSGGGNATATAMFTRPDLFKVGVAQAGNHDNLTYEDDWAERYHGLMAVNEDGSSNYTGQDNAAHAHNLQGKLLLVHGMLDDNVPVQGTLLVVDALVKANKDFDLLLLPQARHGFGSGATGMYVTRRRWDYFVEHLMGATPPRQYQLKPAP